jgi:hypothetical protein
LYCLLPHILDVLHLPLLQVFLLLLDFHWDFQCFTHLFFRWLRLSTFELLEFSNIFWLWSQWKLWRIKLIRSFVWVAIVQIIQERFACHLAVQITMEISLLF